MASPPRANPAVHLESQGTALSRISLRNFRGHADTTLGMGRITVLMGPTGSGKSTVLQALNLLRSALGSDGGALRNGDIAGHGRFSDIVTGGDEGRQVAIGVDGNKKVRVGGGGSGGEAVRTEFSCTLALGGPPLSPGLDAAVTVRCGPPTGASTVRLEHSHGAGMTLVSGAGTPGGGPVPAQADGGLVPRVRADLAECPAARAFRALFGGGEYLGSLLDDLWRVPLSRAVPPDMLPPEFGASIMPPGRTRAAAAASPPECGGGISIREKISEMAEGVCLKRLEARAAPVVGGKESVPAPDFAEGGQRSTIVNGGSGPSRLAAMFAVLACSPSGSVVTIEEPEMHLDPASQARLAGIMVRQVLEEGKQVVFTTHSDHLLYPLLAYVKKKECPLACGDVSMHYFDTDGSGAVAGAARLDINEHGQIDGGLRGFWDADMKAMGEILGREPPPPAPCA